MERYSGGGAKGGSPWHDRAADPSALASGRIRDRCRAARRPWHRLRPSGRATALQVGPATIRFAYSAEQNEIVHFDKIVDIVKQKVPQVTVTSEVYGAGTAAVHAQILVLWAAGTAPDITQISPNNIPPFVQKSSGLAAIDDLVKRDRHDVNDFWPQVMGLGKWKEKLYTLPLGGGPNPFFFNPKHFREAGIDSPAHTRRQG